MNEYDWPIFEDSADWCEFNPELAASRIQELRGEVLRLSFKVADLERDREALARSTALAVAMPQPYRRTADGTVLHNETLGVNVIVAREALAAAQDRKTTWSMLCWNIGRMVQEEVWKRCWDEVTE